MPCISKAFTLFTIISFFGFAKLNAQSVGDYRSNATNMNWNTAASWQKFNGTSWVATADYPGQNSCSSCAVTIRNGNTVTLNVSPANSIGNLVIGGGTNGTLTLGTYTLTVSGDLTVNTGASFNLSTGTFTVNGTTTTAGNVSDASNTGINKFTGLVTKNGGSWNSTSVTTAANMLFHGGFTNNAGSFSAGAATVGDNKTLTGIANMSFANGLAVSGNGDISIAGTASTGVYFAGTANYTVRNLTVTGRLAITTSGSLTVTGATSITGDGSFIDNNNGGVTSFQGLVTHNSTGSWTSTSVTTASNMVFSAGFSNIAGTFNAGAASLPSGQTLNGTIRMTFNNGLTVGGAGNITFSGAGGVRLGGTAINYTIPGNLTLTGTLLVSTTGNFSVGGTTSITGAGDFTDNNNTGVSTFTGLVTHNSTGRWVSTSVTTPSRMIFSSGFTNSAGSFSAGGATIGDNKTLTGTVNMTFSRGLTVLGNGDITIAGTATTGVTFGGTGIAYAVRNLTITGLLTVSTSGNFSVTGTTNISGNGSFIDSQGSGVSTFTGKVTIGNTSKFTATAVTTVGRLNFAGGIVNNNTTALSFNAATIRTTATQTWSGAGSITTSGVIDVNTGTLTNNMTGTVSIGGTLTGTSFIQGANAFLSLGSNTPLSITTLTATAFGNTVEYRSTGTATMRGQTYYHLLISAGIKNIPTTDITVNGNLTINAGILSNTTNNKNIILAGNWINNVGTGAFAAGNGTVLLSGASAQTIGGSGSTNFRNLTINNAAGISQAINTTVNGVLTLTSGIINTAGNTLIISSTGSVSRTSGHINGNEQRSFSTGLNVSRVFDIGDASKYTPVTINFSNVSAAGNITINTTIADHPLIISAQLNGAHSVNRYWTITNAGVAFTSYSAVFNFVSTDMDAGSNTSSFIIGNENGTWSYPTVGTKTSTSTQATGITSFGDFAVAEYLSCTTPTLIITNPAAFCTPATVNLTAPAVTAGSTAGQTFTYWTNSTATAPLPSPAAVASGGTYYIKGTVAGGCSNIKPVVVTRSNPTGILTGTATVCAGSGATLNINVTGTGTWNGTLSDGTVFSGTTGPISVNVSPIINTTYTISTLSDAACIAQPADKSGSATITLAALPSASNAGPDQNTCDDAVILSANNPAIGSGIWSIVSGSGGSFNSLTDPAAVFTGMAGELYVLRWSVSNGPCAVSSDDVVIDFTSGSWTGAVDSNWNNAANWCNGIVPAGMINLALPAGLPNYPVISDNVIVNDLAIAAGAAIKIDSIGKLTVQGSYSNSGTLANNGIIVLNGTAQQIFPGATATVTAMKHLEVDNDAGVVIDQSFGITGTLTPTSGIIDLADQKITLVSDINGTARVAETGGGFDYSAGGKFIVQRYFPARRAWRLVTAPITNSNTIRQGWQNNGVYTPGEGTMVTGSNTANGLDAISGASLKDFDILAQNLLPMLNTNVPVSPGTNGSADNKGYFLFVRGDRNPANLNVKNMSATRLSSEGQLQTGTQLFTASPVRGNYTLIGNPFASPIDFNTITRSNVLKRFYAWDPNLNTVGGYVVLDDLDDDGEFSSSVIDNPQTSEILSHQAVFVETIADGPASVTIEESDKSDGSSYLLSRPAKPASVTARLNINLYLLNADKSTVLADGLRAEFNSVYNNDVNAEDAVKFSNVNETFGLMRNDKFLAIERRQPLIMNDTLYLRATKTTQRNYQFVFKPENLSSAGVTAYLADAYLNTETQLSLDAVSTVTFSINSDAASASPDRFKVLFKSYTVLPVTFTSIKAASQQKDIKVDWTVENEVNIEKYELQKSNDGNNFSSIATLYSNAVNGSAQYSWLDKNVADGNNFYRVKSVGRDGKSFFSDIVKVAFDNSILIKIYNNPAQPNVINVVFNKQAAGSYSVHVYNSNGQVLFKKSINIAGKNTVQLITIPGIISKGIYHVEVKGPGNIKAMQPLMLQ